MKTSAMTPAQLLHCLSFFTLYLATGYGQDGKFTGPLKPMTFSVFEGQEPSQMLFQFKASRPDVTFKLSGETDGIFEIEADGLLYHRQPLDREKRAVHHLQVSAVDTKGVVVEGPVTITIVVKDINDNQPVFTQSSYEGSVRQNSRPGRPFMYVNATDGDDPNTPNGQLLYQILIQLPKVNDVMYFQINNRTGGISLTLEGSRALDHTKNPSYNLVVSVKDLGEHSFSETTSVDIQVMENIWKAPEPVEITENLSETHPVKITQVRWNEPGADYALVQREREQGARFPFAIDKEGDIFVTEPLDREEKDSYTFYAVAKDEGGKPLALPLDIFVTVKDVNDNPPTCPSDVTVFEIQENENIGSDIGTFTAQDLDEKNTENSILKYRIVDQTPKLPLDNLFMVQNYLGVLQLSKQNLKKQDSPQYNLTIEVSDKDFKTLCLVQINVIDINDQIPIFEKSNYGNLTYPEDTPLGEVILTIQATDSDEPFTGSSKIVYRIVEGDNKEQLEVDTDPLTNAGLVRVKKPLDFEATPVHNIVVKAENPEPLVSGVNYNTSSFTSFTLFVTDVDEAPLFSQYVFQAKVSEDVAVGTSVARVTAEDPEGLDISYYLKGETRGWLKIDKTTGDILTAAQLDRETESLHRVQVVATEKAKSFLSSSVEFHLTITDVNDSPPRLAKDYTDLFFCSPLKAPGSLIFEAADDDEESLLGPRFTFALGSEHFKNDWEISKINGSHAKLSTKHTNFEERLYNIPVRINDQGRPPLESLVSLPVTFCTCVDGSCYRPVAQQPGRPTVGMAVGILLTTLLVIGIILAVVFIRIKNKSGENVENAQPSEVKPLRD